MRDYASQFETLLGRLDSYDEGQMLNQFVWGLQPDLARSVSLHYPRTIAKAVSLAETTELAVKASRKPNWKSNTSGKHGKGPKSTKSGPRPMARSSWWKPGWISTEEILWGRLGVTPEAEVEEEVVVQ